ncbi:MAG TPA: class I SAM-dependent methyltransferase [Candidatus Sulfotelmatobacter sp.]|nr:class I SAM-dependent methyltransferase [Candidatus Sulfotelmatobacter sp.]
MLDVAHYRRAEAIARMQTTSWRIEQAHRPHEFEHVGFPTRVESCADLAALVDTMQEERFDCYQAEMGGLSDEDAALLIAKLAQFCRFYAVTFERSWAPLPLDTMTAHLVLWTKIRGFLGAVPASVLEIGPGCGYLAFFLADHPHLRYAQVETTESFYLLQHLVNAWCYGLRAIDRAPITTDTDRTDVLRIGKSASCEHFPWWLDTAPSGPFAVITANACLTELSRAALERYAALIGRALAPDGAVIVQCIGGGKLPWRDVLETFAGVGLGPLVQARRQPSTVDVLFRRGVEPLRRADAERWDPLDPLVQRVYLPGDAPRRTWSRAELETAVAAELERLHD